MSGSPFWIAPFTALVLHQSPCARDTGGCRQRGPKLARARWACFGLSPRHRARPHDRRGPGVAGPSHQRRSEALAGLVCRVEDRPRQVAVTCLPSQPKRTLNEVKVAEWRDPQLKISPSEQYRLNSSSLTPVFSGRGRAHFSDAVVVRVHSCHVHLRRSGSSPPLWVRAPPSASCPSRLSPAGTAARACPDTHSARRRAAHTSRA